jgi:hypothetical protein
MEVNTCLSTAMNIQTTDSLTLVISNDKIDQIRHSAIRAATNGVLRGETPPVIGPKDLCITPILKYRPNPTCSTVKLSDSKRNVYIENE